MECVCLIMIMAQEICMQLNKLMTVMVVSSALALSGCSAMGTAIKKRNQIGRASCRERVFRSVTGVQTCALPI